MSTTKNTQITTVTANRPNPLFVRKSVRERMLTMAVMFAAMRGIEIDADTISYWLSEAYTPEPAPEPIHSLLTEASAAMRLATRTLQAEIRSAVAAAERHAPEASSKNIAREVRRPVRQRAHYLGTFMPCDEIQYQHWNVKPLEELTLPGQHFEFRAYAKNEYAMELCSRLIVAGCQTLRLIVDPVNTEVLASRLGPSKGRAQYERRQFDQRGQWDAFELQDSNYGEEF